MLRYSGTTIGKIRIAQSWGDNEKHEFNVQIRLANCVAALIHVRRATEEDNKRYGGKGGYIHTLYGFFADEKHLKNLLKEYGSVILDEVKSIELNMYYKECWILLKYFVKSGYKVKCYYEEGNKKK